jgi:hypothetical protein
MLEKIGLITRPTKGIGFEIADSRSFGYVAAFTD